MVFPGGAVAVVGAVSRSVVMSLHLVQNTLTMAYTIGQINYCKSLLELEKNKDEDELFGGTVTDTHP